MRAHARAIVDQFGNKLRATLRFGIANRSIPIQGGRTVRVGVRVTLQVLPLALPDDNVRNAVAVQIRESHGVELGERHVPGVLGREVAHDSVLDE